MEELIDLVSTFYLRFKVARREAYVAAIAAGELLNEAKNRMNHGDWLPWLEKTGIAPRTAQRWMLLARFGFEADTLIEAGGTGAALVSLRDHHDDTIRWLAAEKRLSEVLPKIDQLEADWIARTTPEVRERVDSQDSEIRQLRDQLAGWMSRTERAEQQAAALRR